MSEKKIPTAKVKVWKCPVCGDLFWWQEAATKHHEETGH